MNKLRLVWEINSIKIAYHILALAELSAILFVAWLWNKLFEVSVMIPLFFVFRKRFSKQWHAKTLPLCAITSVIVFALFIIPIVPSKSIGILGAPITIYFVNVLSYYIRYYQDLRKERKESDSIKLEKGISKENFNKLIIGRNLTEIEMIILTKFYVENHKMTEIAKELNYSYAYIVELKDKAKEKLSK